MWWNEPSSVDRPDAVVDGNNLKAPRVDWILDPHWSFMYVANEKE